MEVFDGRVKMSLPCPMIRQRKWMHFDRGVKMSLPCPVIRQRKGKCFDACVKMSLPCPMIRQNDVLKCHYMSYDKAKLYQTWLKNSYTKCVHSCSKMDIGTDTTG